MGGADELGWSTSANLHLTQRWWVLSVRLRQEGGQGASWHLGEADFKGQSGYRWRVGSLTVIKTRHGKGPNHCARDGEEGLGGQGGNWLNERRGEQT